MTCGLATLDVVQLVDDLPAPNQKVVSLDFLIAAGGPATNAAVAAAWCGAEATLVTALPRHPLTDLIAADLASCRVGLDVADHDFDGPPPTAAILITRGTGDRAVVSPTAVGTGERAPAGELEDPARLAGVGALLIDGYHRHLALPLARAARAAGVPVILDGGSAKAHTEELLEVVDVAIVSDDFAPPGVESEAGAVLDWLFERGVENAAVSRGGRAIAWRTRAGAGEVPVAPVEVVDTLGAGDFFHGAVAFRIAGLGLDDARLAEDLAWAAAVAGASLGSFGTRAWLAGAPPAGAPPATAPQ